MFIYTPRHTMIISPGLAPICVKYPVQASKHCHYLQDWFICSYKSK